MTPIPDLGDERQRVPMSRAEIIKAIEQAERDATNPSTPGTYAIIIISLIRIIRQLLRELEQKDYPGE